MDPICFSFSVRNSFYIEGPINKILDFVSFSVIKVILFHFILFHLMFLKCEHGKLGWISRQYHLRERRSTEFHSYKFSIVALKEQLLTHTNHSEIKLI